MSPDQRAHLDRAVAIASGVVCDARSDDDRVVPGQRIAVTLECWNTGTAPHSVTVALHPAKGFTVEGQGATTLRLDPGALASGQTTAVVAGNAPMTVPYFKLSPSAARSTTTGAPPPPAVRGEPFGPPELTASFLIDSAATVTREVARRVNDQARGEIRRPVAVVPRVNVAIDPATAVWPAGDPRPRRFTVTVTHGARDTTNGTATLEVPAGWPRVTPQSFRFTREDERETLTFELRPPAGLRTGTAEIRAVARDAAGHRFDVGVVTVDYPHIRPRSYLRPSVAVLRVAPLALPRLARLGYVRGAADRVPEALRGVGLPVTVLDAATLEGGDLGRFDAIVVGPRAYETDSALVEANARLLDYARRGGRCSCSTSSSAYFDGRLRALSAHRRRTVHHARAGRP